jgi:type IV secretion system protein VirB1
MTTNLAALMMTCAPLVHPATLHALIEVESAGNPYAVSVNRPEALERAGIELPSYEQPQTPGAALQLIRSLSALGLSTSVGLAQINVEHLRVLGVRLPELLNPCKNLSLAQRILLDCDASQAPRSPVSVHRRLRRTLTCYNSGHFEENPANHYASDVARAAARQARRVAKPARSPT